MLALLHGVLRHLDVGLPIGHNVDQVEVGTLDELLPRVVGAVVELCRVATILSENGVTLLRAILVKVAEGHDIRTLDEREAIDGTHAAHTETDDTDPDGLELGGTEGQHILLPRRTLRDGSLDHTRAGLVRTSLLGAAVLSHDRRDHKGRQESGREILHHFHKNKRISD